MRKWASDSKILTHSCDNELTGNRRFNAMLVDRHMVARAASEAAKTGSARHSGRGRDHVRRRISSFDHDGWIDVVPREQKSE